MAYFDLAGATKVVELMPMLNYPPSTYSPSYSAPNFTYALDTRPYLGALIFVLVEAASGDAEMTVSIQSAGGPDFTSWSTVEKVGGGGASFAAINSSNDNQLYYAKVDLSKVQNAIGVEVVQTATGGARIRFGVYAVLFPKDTTDASDPQFTV